MKRLLCIVGSMNRGGAETFLMKIYRTLDKEKYQMDFAVAGDGVYDKEIESYGGKIWHITPKSKSAWKNFTDIKNLVKEQGYKSVLRSSQNSLSALELFAAKLGGAKIRAYRSSNSQSVSGTKKEDYVHRLCMFMPRFFANVKIAPSTEAAVYMFGKKGLRKGKVQLLHNAVDLDLFKYSENGRIRIRKELGVLDNEIVVGHIGRFNQQKNHKFLINVFAAFLKNHPRSKLVLVGKGEKEEDVRLQANQLGIEDNVLFVGVREDIPDLLSAMDVFCFPSFYEGMPNTVIEAQAVGLPCLISNRITKEAEITGILQYKSLNDSPQAWAESLDGILNEFPRHSNTKAAFVYNRYDIQSVSQDFISLLY